jgi:rubrerythrin
MKEFDSIKDILDFAIGQEQEAVDFYNKLASTLSNEAMKKVFEDFAWEEMKHKTKLLEIQQTGMFETGKGKVMDLKIADYMVKVQPNPDMTYQDALVLAMSKEKSAFRLYMSLSERAQDAALQSIFLMLAQEEAKHKLRFEIEYDEFVLREN